MKKAFYRYIPALALLIIALAIFFFPTTPSTPAPEIEKIKTLTSTKEQSEELLKLLKRVGPIETQELMVRSGMPFTGETHLLIHTIGDYIYDEYGQDGLSYCKDYFLSACYHAFIINTLGDSGLDGMANVMEKCEIAGPGVPSQCAHGSGHGFVAWQDYDLVKALEMCDKLGEKSPNFPYFNCYDGVFMENIWGVHNGAPSEKRWIKDNDIYYPCNDPRIPEKYLRGCWSNQATLIYQHYKGDLKQTALACDAVENPEYRDVCYDNLARQIHPMTDGSLEKVASLCSVATGEARRNECILINMTSYWSVGDRVVPFEICDSLSGELQNQCFDRLIGSIRFETGQNLNERKTQCDKISSEIHRNKCRE